LLQLCRAKKWDAAQELIERTKSDAETLSILVFYTQNGESPLTVACEESAPYELVKTIIRASKSDPRGRNVCDTAQRQLSPLHHLAKHSSCIPTIKLVIRTSPGNLTKKINNQTPLQVAKACNFNLDGKRGGGGVGGGGGGARGGRSEHGRGRVNQASKKERASLFTRRGGLTRRASEAGTTQSEAGTGHFLFGEQSKIGRRFSRGERASEAGTTQSDAGTGTGRKGGTQNARAGARSFLFARAKQERASPSTRRGGRARRASEAGTMQGEAGTGCKSWCARAQHRAK
jgi:hypothetical protein